MGSEAIPSSAQHAECSRPEALGARSGGARHPDSVHSPATVPSTSPGSTPRTAPTTAPAPPRTRREGGRHGEGSGGGRDGIPMTLLLGRRFKCTLQTPNGPGPGCPWAMPAPNSEGLCPALHVVCSWCAPWICPRPATDCWLLDPRRWPRAALGSLAPGRLGVLLPLGTQGRGGVCPPPLRNVAPKWQPTARHQCTNLPKAQRTPLPTSRCCPMRRCAMTVSRTAHLVSTDAQVG